MSTPSPAGAWQMSSTAPSGIPVGHSTTAGCLAEPLTLSSTVPGSSGTPTAANRSGPSSASTAIWANVEALDSRVGRSATPLSEASVLRPGGTGFFPLMPRTSAPASPEMNRSGCWTTRIIDCSPGSAAMAASIDRFASSLPATPMMTSSAPIASATSAAPLRIRYGDLIISILSLNDPGSPSVAFTTTIVGWPVLRAVSMTALSLRANGKAAPPWPRRSTWDAIATRSSAESRGSGPKISLCAARSSRASRSRPAVILAAPIRMIVGTSSSVALVGFISACHPRSGRHGILGSRAFPVRAPGT